MKFSSYKKGLFAEYYCIFFLFLSGYRILNHRYKTKVGEIDIIAKKGKNIAFIEVKARDNLSQGLEAISKQSMKRIEKTAKLWIAKNHQQQQSYNFQFDLIIVTSFYKKPKLYKNAWQM